MPLLYKLPSKWTDPWLDLLNPEWAWKHLHAPFEKLGTDIFLTVSPGGNMVWCANASAISQITTRRNDFPKPIEIYGSVDLFGKNVVTTEGAVWRQHRKITSPPFTEKNNHLVWAESLHQARSMVESWVGPDGAGNKTIGKVADDTMRLSLHVISRAGFGVRLLWPGIEDATEKTDRSAEIPGAGQETSTDVPKGHTMSYTDALGSLLHNILWVMLLPRWLLIALPFKPTRKAYQSYSEWDSYMKEMYAAKKAEVLAGEEREGMDLMGALVKGAGITPETLGEPFPSEKRQAPSDHTLTDDEILGNAFVFILAGHETTANSIHFSLLYLALHVQPQRRLQKDLDSVFQGRSISEWDYERDLPNLFGGMAGAVLNEELRLIPPVISIPKKTADGSPQTLLVDGKKVYVEGGTQISLVAAITHRNPRYWPHSPPSDPEHPAHPESNLDNDLEEFKPERWLLASSSAKGMSNGHADVHHQVDKAETDDLGVNTAADTAANLFHPLKGAYIPFSEGFRACLGRRFAQVEVLAVLAVIFSQYSVELAVDEYATDEEVKKMDESGKREVWGRAATQAKTLMRTGMG
ncbi:MAG: hypothetical protein M1830_001356, partial [Pleopsidium flavum]